MFFLYNNYDDMQSDQSNYYMMCANIATDVMHFLPPLFVLYSTQKIEKECFCKKLCEYSNENGLR